MKNNNVIDAVDRFEARQPWNVKLRERLLDAHYSTMVFLGRLGASSRHESSAYRYGVRRSTLALGLASVALVANLVIDSEAEENRRTAVIQECVDTHTPEGSNLIVKDIGDGLAYGDTSGEQFQGGYVIGEAPDAENKTWQTAEANGKILKLCLDLNTDQ